MRIFILDLLQKIFWRQKMRGNRAQSTTQVCARGAFGISLMLGLMGLLTGCSSGTPKSIPKPPSQISCFESNKMVPMPATNNFGKCSPSTFRSTKSKGLLQCKSDDIGPTLCTNDLTLNLGAKPCHGPGDKCPTGSCTQSGTDPNTNQPSYSCPAPSYTAESFAKLECKFLGCACKVDADCCDGFQCLSGKCMSLCCKGIGEQCKTSSDCCGQSCKNGKCMAATCQSNSDCPAGQTCGRGLNDSRACQN